MHAISPVMVIIVSTSMAFQEDVKDERVNYWADFGAGSSCKFRVTIRRGEAVVQTGEGRKTLNRVEDQKIEILFDDILGLGRGVELPRGNIVIGMGRIVGRPKILGTEEVSIGSSKYKCQIIETAETGRTTSDKRSTKVWKAPEAPGKVVKEEIRIDGEVVITGTLISNDDRITVSGKELRCWVFQSEERSPTGTSVKIKTWYSDGVPGGEVKKVITVSAGEGKGVEAPVMTTTYELLEYEKK